MKKLVALALTLIFCLSLVACGGGAKNAAIVDYVENNKSTLISSMESSFATSSGMTCKSDIYVEDMGFVIKINVNELDNIDDATKAQLQSTYDSMDSTFETMLTTMQKEVPEIEYFELQLCEKDGDLLATILAGNK